MRSRHTSYILKLTKSVREYAFYTQVAPQLPTRGIAVPRLLGAGQDTAGAWLVLEDISRPLPRSRWLADPEMLMMLRRLHRLTPAFPIPQAFESDWTLEMTDALGQRLPAACMPILQTLHERHATFFHQQCVISGDPNPTNWGLRTDGTLVLFDWERVGFGIPAIDLAITVPGLGMWEEYHVAQTYLSNLPDTTPDTTPGAVEQLVHAIAIAKLWVVIDYVTSPAESQKHHNRAAALLDAVPSWLRDLHAQDEAFHRAVAAGGR